MVKLSCSVQESKGNTVLPKTFPEQVPGALLQGGGGRARGQRKPGEVCQGSTAPGLSTGIPTNFAVPHSYISSLCHPKPGMRLYMTDGRVCGGFEKSKGRDLDQWREETRNL